MKERKVVLRSCLDGVDDRCGWSLDGPPGPAFTTETESRFTVHPTQTSTSISVIILQQPGTRIQYRRPAVLATLNSIVRALA